MEQKGVVPLILDDGLVEEISSSAYNVTMINSIDTKYKSLRQDSKAP